VPKALNSFIISDLRITGAGYDKQRSSLLPDGTAVGLARTQSLCVNGRTARLPRFECNTWALTGALPPGLAWGPTKSMMVEAWGRGFHNKIRTANTAARKGCAHPREDLYATLEIGAGAVDAVVGVGCR
jgi:hypothetical protein